MLAKKNRLSGYQVAEVLKTGQKEQGSFFDLVYTLNNQSDTPSKLSVTVPKKVVKTAVGRNRVKRRIRAVLLKEVKKLKPGIKGVVFVRTKINHKHHQEIKKEIKEVFQQLNLYA
jgi:ribonuclease P protein component